MLQYNSDPIALLKHALQTLLTFKYNDKVGVVEHGSLVNMLFVFGWPKLNSFKLNSRAKQGCKIMRHCVKE